MSRNIVSLHLLGCCFAFFTLRDQLVARARSGNKTDLLRVEEMQRSDWLICLVWIQEKLEFDEKPKFVIQSRPALYFSQQLSSTRNKCFCWATS